MFFMIAKPSLAIGDTACIICMTALMEALILAEEEGAETFSVIYDGGLAAAGQLHFYEYSRGAYAVARLITTI